MNQKYFLIIVFFISDLYAEVRVVCTAALTESHYDFREKQYREAFTILKNYGVSEIFIVEALKKQGPTFFEEISSHVFYATVNNPSFQNNGINEAATFLEALYYFDFDDKDMIIKFTGRHQLTSDFLLRLVENNSEYDAFVKVNSDGNVFTLGFAMRCKDLKEMFGCMNFDAMGHIMRPIEYDVGDYIKLKIRQGNFKVYYVDKLYMKANIFGSSTAPNVAEQIKYY